jgi:hypothetical protein
MTVKPGVGATFAWATGPPEWRVAVTPVEVHASLPSGALVVGTVVWEDGAYLLDAVRVERPAGGHLSAGDLEAVPVAAMVDRAAAAGATNINLGFLSDDPDERKVQEAALAQRALRGSLGAGEAAVDASRGRARRHRRNAGLYARVAAFYAEAAEAGRRPIVRAVADHFDVSESTAVKYIAEARKAGILTTPAPRGRPRGS